MKNKITVAAILAALLLGGAYYLRAQMDNYTDTNMDDPRRQEERQPAGPRMMGMPGGMGGGAGCCSMTAFERHIYVLSGNTLYKVDPADMKVMKELQLPRRPGAPAGGHQGRPGTMGGQ